MPNVAAVIQSGFDGKLPSRGDFVSRGLPRSFLTPWRAWIDAALSASRTQLGDAWIAAWLEAPVWRFALPGGTCGPDAVLGLMMPSVDSVGRHYPLTLAATFAARTAVPAALEWLDEIEIFGRDAIAHDFTPDDLMRLFGVMRDLLTTETWDAAQWWTAGSPRVPSTRLNVAAFPPPADFASMIDASQKP